MKRLVNFMIDREKLVNGRFTWSKTYNEVVTPKVMRREPGTVNY